MLGNGPVRFRRRALEKDLPSRHLVSAPPHHPDGVAAGLEITRVVEDQHSAGGSPIASTTYPRTSSRTASASQTASPSSRCIACGEVSPARSANCQHDRVSTSESTPSRNDRACRRGSRRLNRPAIRANPRANSSTHPATSTLPDPAVTPSEIASTTADDHAVGAVDVNELVVR